jgi:hypothetical protein
VEGGGVMGSLEVAEQAFGSSVADLEDAAIGFLAVATPEEGMSAQEHLEAVHAAADDLLSMAVRLSRRVSSLRMHDCYKAVA